MMNSNNIEPCRKISNFFKYNSYLSIYKEINIKLSLEILVNRDKPSNYDQMKFSTRLF
jgi:hypothetical protein